MTKMKSVHAGRRGRPPGPPRSLDERFDVLVEIHPPDGTHIFHEWLGSTDRYGYGRFSVKSRYVGAHKFALERKLGYSLEPGVHACHECDTPLCVNPACLFEGSPARNAHDKVMKGRCPNPYARIAELEGQVRELRAALEAPRG